MPDWRHCEGELANGQFPLDRYLGGNETSAVFVTRFGSGRAAIKVEAADPVRSRQLVERWNRAAALNHPHLAQVYAAGAGVLAGVPVAYLVTEYAEENLAEVLRDRPLTSDETREMLLPVADALSYLHSHGLVQGDLKPSKILAVGETVKVSSDSISGGDPAGDVRALGVTMLEALTQRPPTLTEDGQDAAVDALPFPFREMAENCLQVDPKLRWSADRVAAWLRSPEQPALPALTSTAAVAKPASGKPRARQYFAAAALMVVGAAFIGAILMHRTAGPIPVGREAVPPTPASEPPAASPKRTVVPENIPPLRSDREATRDRLVLSQDGVTRRVLPDIPAKARNTIQGKPTVVVRVTVDSAGKVKEATLERSFSPYMGKLVLEAARRWQFAPVDGENSRNWILRFEITRTATQVTARRAGGQSAQ
jgi:TonB family protein